MTAMELQQWKQNIIHDYLEKIDEKENTRPCVVHSQEEMIAKIWESEEDIKHGRIISNDDLEKEMETWF